MNGKEIKRLRNKMEMTQEAFALALGAKPPQISRWESGHVQMGKLYQEKVKRMAEEHGIQAN